MPDSLLKGPQLQLPETVRIDPNWASSTCICDTLSKTFPEGIVHIKLIMESESINREVYINRYNIKF